MAPSLKELETVPAAPNTPATPQTKSPSPNESTARPQPVALEIPVTVNGAHTVEGSDKRAPFSENTQTVLVFPHGAVIRIATALAPGQLVFLTNEKTKKEVVCQVIKSRSSGGAGAYVELQFTEPAPGFWGVQLPGASAPAPAPRPAPPVAPPAPAAPKAAAPVPPAPVAPKPPLAAKPVAPAPISAPPARPVAPPATPPVVPPAPVSSLNAQMVTPPPPSPIAPPEKAPVAAAPHAVAPEPVKTPPVSVVPPAPGAPEPRATHPAPHTPETHPPAIPVSPLRDYSKQIEALFSAPQAPPAPAAPESHPAPVSSEPSTEQLRQEAARLQAQLGSMLFTEKPAAPPVPVAPKAPAPVAEISNKLLEAIAEEPKAVAPVESKPVSPQRKPPTTTLGADEEVKVPSWLAPLQHAETAVTEPPSAPETAADVSVPINSEESFDALVTSAAPQQRPETAVFGGQLLGEASAASETASTGSKKRLLIGIAATLLMVAGGGYHYFHQNGSTPAAVAAKHSAEVPATNETAPASSVPSTPVGSTATAAKSNAPALATQPTRNAPPPVTTPAVSTSVSMAPSKNTKPTPKNAEPAPEEQPKSVMGDVHLAAPVVGHSDTTQPVTDALQNIDTKTIPGDADAFASAAARRAGPAAPLPVGGDVKQAQLLKAVPPVYPPLAKAQHVSGSVRIDALIDTSGNVAAAKIISGPTLLHRAALDAVKQWKYAPAMLDGEPTAAHLTVTVDFHGQ